MLITRIATLAVVLLWIQCVGLAVAATKPNLLIITADDLNGDSWFNCPVRATPNLDAFAATCARFEQSHLVAPICQPSREALMTGRVPHRSGGLGFTPIRLDVPTLIEITGSNGYFTAAINKLAHMAPPEKFRWHLRLDGSGKNPKVIRAHFEQCLKSAADSGKPFFINANITDPHRPFPGSENEAARSKKKKASRNQADSSPAKLYSETEIRVPGFLEDLPEIRKELAQYFSGVRRMDESFSELLGALKASGQETNTVIAFLADNGMSAPFAKATVYRNGTWSPLLLRWPKMVPPFVNRDDLISSVDIMPTLLDLLSLPHPPGMDGRSFVPLLRGESQPGRDHVFTHVNTVSSGKAFPQRCVRTKSRAYIWNAWSDGTTRFKVEAMSGLTFNALNQAAEQDRDIKRRVDQFLIRTTEEFYDNQRDPDERHNLINAPAYEREVHAMRQMLLTEMRRSNDPLLAQFVASTRRPQDAIQCIEPSAETGSSLAVLVDDVPLLHTAQILPVDRQGKLVDESSAQQAEQLFSNLTTVLEAAKSDLSQVLKVNVYLAHEKDRSPIQQVLARRFASSPDHRRKTRPAVSFVVGELPVGASVAMDAVAATSIASPSGRVQRFSAGGVNRAGYQHAAILPAGPKVYVSGMADTNELKVATVKTLEKLMAALKHLELDRSHVVQLKAFLQPMSEVDLVREAMVGFFEGDAPPLVFVQWISPGPNPPVEIELIAAGKGDFSKEPSTVSFITPPGTTASKVFSRVARVNHGKLIYISGLYGLEGQSGADQIRRIFHSLGETLRTAGSDFDHLVKATYYVSDDDASGKLNTIRPEFYHPERPPAASKAKVKAVGMPGRTVTMDMIAVTK